MSALPLIQGGGSLLLAWRIANKKVLIVGGGNVAAQRIVSLKCADAAITLVCPHQGLIPETRARIEQGEVAAWVDRVFQDSDLEDCVMVLTALDDHEESLRIGHLCRAQNIPVNVADVPPMCDFYFMSQHRDGPLQIAVSTNGQGPKLANMIRTDLANALPSRIGETIRKMGLLRAKVREWEPAVDQSSRRMGWVIRCCEAWGLETMAQWNDLTPSEEEAMYSVLYDYYQCNQVPEAHIIFPAIPSTATVHSYLQEMSIHHRQLLVEADLVVSDRKIPHELLALVEGEVRIAPHTHTPQQKTQQEKAMLAWCLAGVDQQQRVVRLKAGTPEQGSNYTSEEREIFQQRGYTTENVPVIYWSTGSKS